MKPCLGCGRLVPKYRKSSSYCSDNCMPAQSVRLDPVGRGAAWSFATDPRLFMSLDERAPVHLWPADLERIERARAKMAR